MSMQALLSEVERALYWAAWLLIFLITAGFSIYSFREKRPWAGLKGLVILCVMVFPAVAGYDLSSGRETLLLAWPGLVLLAAFLVFGRVGTTSGLEFVGPLERFDERDTMFAREEYLPSTDKYRQYYSTHPENKDADDRIRKLPKLLEPGGRFFQPFSARYIQAVFDQIKSRLNEVDGPVEKEKLDVDPLEITARLKEVTLAIGALQVGVAEMNQAFVYTNAGRGPSPFGSLIENRHKYALVFSVEMDYREIDKAPLLDATKETARRYLDVANLSLLLASVIRKLGYPARAHIPESNYQVILPALAWQAGLGELGRNGYLISGKAGARVRLGAVTTDLPLVADRPVVLGVQDFCAKCRRCAQACPPRAIPLGEKINVRGVLKWQLKAEACLSYWRAIGTDCGICMKVCPFSHPSNLFHDAVRFGISRSAPGRGIFLVAEELMYGKIKGKSPGTPG
ncbi:MAG: 4Fe-4S dicluster domain-containing protein [Deltaproteobacteria bacterium]|nr:4Fe-4S dicluster domain-containing protein [Deltaproteobacteria bacterium]